MSRTWQMRKVTGYEEREINFEGRTWWRRFFVMDCGHKRQNATEYAGGVRWIEYGPGPKNVGDKARCYECKRSKTDATA